MFKAGLRRNVHRPVLPLPLYVRSRRSVTNLPPSTPPPTPPSSRLARYIPRLSDISTRSGLPLPSLAISFAILHELTAILPLLALFFAFQAFGVGGTIIKWASRQEDGDDLGLGSYIRDWLEEGQKRVDKVARRYGLFGYERGSKAVAEEDRMSSEQEALQVAAAAKQSSAAAGVASAVAAYVVVKVSIHAPQGHTRLEVRRAHVLLAAFFLGNLTTTDRRFDRLCSRIHAIRPRTFQKRDLARIAQTAKTDRSNERKRHDRMIR
jgi:hypothetical protein